MGARCYTSRGKWCRRGAGETVLGVKARAGQVLSFEEKTKKTRTWFYGTPRMQTAIKNLAAIDRKPLSMWIRHALEDEVRRRSEELVDL